MKIRRTKADDLFSRYIRARDKVCQMCGKADGLQCAHIYSRRHWNTRHDPGNALALCFHCHQKSGENPLDFAKWCDKRFGSEAMYKLSLRAHATGKKSKHDEGLRVMALKEMLSRQI